MKKLLLASLAAVLLFSCKKDDDGNPPCDTTVSSLAGTYKLESIKYKPGSAIPEIDVTDQLDDCERDDQFTLNANGTVVYTDAGTACNPNGDNTGTWSLSSGNQIMVTGGSEDIAGTIESYDCNKLVVVANNLNVAGDKTTFTLDKQ